ncbi:hypothetical protein [cyanobacterium endosymbiont of Rhopalodia gibberula]|uniref:hypothetical protein n=1 Tax=cyanobacterium endosymbiont of Rhopalodia gibberula TaxID=1763363 RepID=UPI003B8310DB
MTGITSSSLYPGFVVTTALFRNYHRLFQKQIPLFQTCITKGFVSEELVGEQVAEVITAREYNQSRAY